MIFEKLYKFIGKNIKSLIDRPDEPYCFRLHKNRVYYTREALMKKATNVSGNCHMCCALGGVQRCNTRLCRRSRPDVLRRLLRHGARHAGPTAHVHL